MRRRTMVLSMWLVLAMIATGCSSDTSESSTSTMEIAESEMDISDEDASGSSEWNSSESGSLNPGINNPDNDSDNDPGNDKPGNNEPGDGSGSDKPGSVTENSDSLEEGESSNQDTSGKVDFSNAEMVTLRYIGEQDFYDKYIHYDQNGLISQYGFGRYFSYSLDNEGNTVISFRSSEDSGTYTYDSDWNLIDAKEPKRSYRATYENGVIISSIEENYDAKLSGWDGSDVFYYVVGKTITYDNTYEDGNLTRQLITLKEKDEEAASVIYDTTFDEDGAPLKTYYTDFPQFQNKVIEWSYDEQNDYYEAMVDFHYFVYTGDTEHGRAPLIVNDGVYLKSTLLKDPFNNVVTSDEASYYREGTYDYGFIDPYESANALSMDILNHCPLRGEIKAYYDQDGRLQTRSMYGTEDPMEEIYNYYDDGSLMEYQVKGWNGYRFRFDRDGRLTSHSLGSGSTEFLSYNDDDLVSKYRFTDVNGQETMVVNLAYDYDAEGRLSACTATRYLPDFDGGEMKLDGNYEEHYVYITVPKVLTQIMGFDLDLFAVNCKIRTKGFVYYPVLGRNYTGDDMTYACEEVYDLLN